MGSCFSDKYKPFDRCLSCVMKKNDTCRFKHFRLFKPLPNNQLEQKGFVTCINAHFFFDQTFRVASASHKRSKLADEPEIPSIKVAPSTYAVPPQEILELNSRYVMAQVKAPLLDHLKESQEFLKSQPTIFYRKPVGPICQTCDVCKTGIFSTFWLCKICGREVCLACYTNWDSELHLRDGLQERCSYRRIHKKADFIPVTNYLPERLDALCSSAESFSHPMPPPIYRDDLLFAPNKESLPYPYLNPTDLTQDVYQSYWRKGQPILMRETSGKALHQVTPEFFIQNYGDFMIESLRLDGSVHKKETIAKFFSTFDDPDSASLDLKIKDFPSGDKFSNILPSLNQDFMNQLPVQEYMNYLGSLNLVSLLPDSHITPDLGPKMYVAYAGTTAHISGTTQLHLDAADAINTLKYSSAPAGVAGAIWHLFRREDAGTIREFIREKFPGITIHDPIHDQYFYLTDALLEELFTSRGVKPFIMEQKVGEVVLIPAGCPHQVRNLYPCIKLAMDYVSPEAAPICSQLASEFRKLPRLHRRNVDIISTPTLLAQAWNTCLQVQGKPSVFQPGDVVMPPVPKRSRSSEEATDETPRPKKKATPKKANHKA
ncbi:hypothetical protein DSO57_1006479 [Entomophthora muscae]|uniref:Uncharacterized protein n=1 Tax=Entomophthora muscae TaxID=34485 RepID=A0ACC2RMD3_9FUNG|nr:hypothetical protein DSO57_1006479 [Entomophthora muscae]